MDRKSLRRLIVNKSERNVTFEALALDVFRYQSKWNSVYAKYIKALGIEVNDVLSVDQVPFLPIEIFKKHEVVSGTRDLNAIDFQSSGTSGQIRSKHWVSDLDLYKENAKQLFQNAYGSLSDFCILAYLPSYHDRAHSSLIYMMDHFIQLSEHPDSGFYLNKPVDLLQTMERNQASGTRTLLMGVSYALMDLAEQGTFDFSSSIIMETGGMKGRRKELHRSELHAFLKKQFGVDRIHSEYGMTELMSQAYSKGEGWFTCNHNLKVYIRQITDPLTLERDGKVGRVDIIDLANIDSCSFIGTQDLGRKLDQNTFEILGRLDAAELRGCNLMYTL